MKNWTKLVLILFIFYVNAVLSANSDVVVPSALSKPAASSPVISETPTGKTSKNSTISDNQPNSSPVISETPTGKTSKNSTVNDNQSNSSTSSTPLSQTTNNKINSINSNTTQSPSTTLDKAYTLLQISGMDGFMLRGSDASREFYIPILKEWALDSVTLHLIIYRVALLSKSTTLTVYVDNFPVGTIELTGVGNLGSTWDVTLPANLVKNDLINTTISGVVNDVGFSCYNLFNPSYWIYISGQSTITYHYKSNAYFPDLSKLPYPFIHNPSLEPDHAVIVLPDILSLKIMASAFNISNMLGSQMTWRGINLLGATVNAIPEDKKNNSNFIFIGTAKDLNLNNTVYHLPLTINQDGKILDTNHLPLPDTTGVIMIATSPWDPKYALMIVTGNSDEAVNRASIMLRNPDFSQSVLFNQFVLVPRKPSIIKKQYEWSDATLKDLGFNNQTVYGSGESAIDYDVNFPEDKQIKGVGLSIHYLASSFLSASAKPFLTIRANGTPIGGITLDISNPKIKTWNFYIDGQNLQPGKNRISFVFNLQLNNRSCTPEMYNLAWATVYSSTEVHVDYDTNPAFLNFSIFNTAYGDLTIAVPILQSFFGSVDFIDQILKLGKKMQEVENVDFIDSSTTFNPSIADQNLLFIGNVDNSPLSPYIKQIPFYLSNNTLHIDPNLLPVLAISSETPKAVVEILPSAFNSNKVMMLITARDSEGYHLGFDLLNNSKKNSLIAGNVVFAYANGTFTSIQSQKLEMTAENKRRIHQTLQYLIYAIIGFVLLIVVGGLLYYIVRKILYYFSKDHHG